MSLSPDDISDQLATNLRISPGSRVQAPNKYQANPFRTNNSKLPASAEDKIKYKQEVLVNADTLVYNNKKHGDLINWAGYHPSQCRVSEGIKNVQVIKPGLCEIDIKPVNQEMLSDLVEEFGALSDSEITAAKLNSLAESYNFKTGKWIMYVKAGECDEIWQKSAKFLLNGKLESISYIKADAMGDPSNSPYDGKEQKICFVTKDFTKSSAVKEAAKEIRHIDKKYTLKYKPDIYSHLNIFAGNKYNIRPTLHQEWGTEDAKRFKQRKSSMPRQRNKN